MRGELKMHRVWRKQLGSAFPAAVEPIGVGIAGRAGGGEGAAGQPDAVGRGRLRGVGDSEGGGPASAAGTPRERRRYWVVRREGL